MAEIKVLLFSCDNYDILELNKMTDKQRFELANVASNFGYDEADILSLAEFQRRFNDGLINEDGMFIFFYQEA